MTIVSPSLLSADFLHLQQDVEMFDRSNAQWLHYDVMDGNFVPNISFGTKILRQVNSATDKFLDVHIMVANPLQAIDYFDGCGADLITFHYEACQSNEECLQVIEKLHEKGLKAGVSVKPNTPVEVLEPLLDKVDLVLVMTVEPGFGGQSFMADQLPKVTAFRREIARRKLDVRIQVDGGVDG
ncbi:MAG: ribulose-phosphate 3-epimerase, partial [Erysipelotrichaceae bacterium]|nr:ribulose-phosphate 3-epimerase [Erysipelotrichaceae bacterium]